MLYDPDALHATFIAKYFLTAPIYAGVGLTVVLSKRQLVTWRNQARDQALHDPLTGLANRRALTDALDGTSSSPPERWPLGLVMIDLDDLKLANTLYGHVGGDHVLRCAADVLSGIVRHDDLLARLGGDEFALLVPGASEAQLDALSQRIVEGMRDARPELSPPGYRLTASVGYALVDKDSGKVDGLLEAADRHLHRAKVAGKDRWDAPSVSELSARLGALVHQSAEELDVAACSWQTSSQCPSSAASCPRTRPARGPGSARCSRPASHAARAASRARPTPRRPAA